MCSGIVVNLTILFLFKYLDFFNTQTRDVLQSIGVNINIPNLEVLVPIGISFYTFQILSYFIDVYNKKIEPEKHLGLFALYVVFFPQLMAGPIERSFHFMPQLRNLLLGAQGETSFAFDEKRISDGFRLMLCGFVKKIVIADNLAIFVDQAYANADFGGITLAIATILFAFQLYYDFSGYTDIARGMARAMGFELIENFRRPYFASSVQDFWRRWHISLTSWFRDYVYISMGGNRVSKNWYYCNIMTVFLLSGLWHGANWTFLVWGFLHGSYYLVGRWTENFRNHVVLRSGLNSSSIYLSVLRILVTFALVSFAWVFFRSPDISTSLSIVFHMGQSVYGILIYLLMKLGLTAPPNISIKTLTGFSGIGLYAHRILIIALIFIMIFEAYELLQEWFNVTFSDFSATWRWSLYYGAVVCIFLMGAQGNQQFIYFQF